MKKGTKNLLFHYEISDRVLDHPEQKKIFNRELKEEFLRILNAGKIIALDELLQEQLQKDGFKSLTPEHSEELHKWYQDVTECRYLRPLFENAVDEWILHTPRCLQAFGGKSKDVTELNISDEDYFLSWQVFSLKNQEEWNYAHPIVSFTSFIHKQSFRFTLIHPSMTQTNLPKVFIRSLARQDLTFDHFSLPQDLQKQVKSFVRDQKNILITGSTGSGKTSFLRVLLREIPESEHLITIEDTRELAPKRPYCTSLVERDRGLSMKELFRHSLRMSPDRLILGEMRGPEALSFLLAMNSGHEGLMSTLHANSAQEALERVALLFHFYNTETSLPHNVLMELLAKNVEYVIHCEDLGIKEIIQVKGVERNQPIFDVIWSREVEATLESFSAQVQGNREAKWRLFSPGSAHTKVE